jgi:hypothetical protein
LFIVFANAAPAMGGEEQPALVEFVYKAEGVRDPFIPLVRDGRVVAYLNRRGPGAALPILFGVLWDPAGGSIALIDNTEARVGDEVSGYRVKEIHKDSVVLTSGENDVVVQVVNSDSTGVESGP